MIWSLDLLLRWLLRRKVVSGILAELPTPENRVNGLPGLKGILARIYMK